MVYGLVKMVLDDYSGRDVHWVADVDTIEIFGSRRERDEEVERRDAMCESYEAWMPFDRRIIHRKIKTSD